MGKKARIFERDGYVFTVRKIMDITGVSQFAARERLTRWQRGLISIEQLLKPRMSKGVDYMRPRGEEAAILKAIPGPTPFEVRHPDIVAGAPKTRW